MPSFKHKKLSANDLHTIEEMILKVAQSPYISLWNESLLDKSEIEVFGCMAGLFKRVNICQLLNISASGFLDFLMDVKSSYQNNPYHSFYHGVDVAMVLYYITQHCQLCYYLNPYYILALMIAGLCHDVGHPGNSNQFQVDSRTKLAQRYGNKSVLESHSASITLELLDKHQLLRHLNNNMFDSSTSTQPTTAIMTYQQFKRVVVKTILSTDMICHSQLKENIDILCTNNKNRNNQRPLKPLFEPHTDPFPYFFKSSSTQQQEGSCSYEKEAQQMICSILLHAADISNPCRPLALAHQFSNLVCTEFFQQQDKKQKVSSFRSTATSKHPSPSDISLGFIDVIVQPYFESLSQLFSNIKDILQQCKENRALWLSSSNGNLNTPPCGLVLAHKKSPTTRGEDMMKHASSKHMRTHSDNSITIF